MQLAHGADTSLHADRVDNHDSLKEVFDAVGALNAGVPSISLCFPCFNEQGVIGDLVRTACNALSGLDSTFEVVVVDDGSTDDTFSIVNQLAKDDERIKLVRHPSNRGYGAAVTTALRSARSDIACLMDGDGQFDPSELPRLLFHMNHADVVIGIRTQRADNFWRRTIGRLWSCLIRRLTGLRVRDIDCGFKVMSRDVLEKVQLTASGSCISAELLIQCSRGGARIREIEVAHLSRRSGKATGAHVRVIATAFQELRIVMRYRNMPPWK